VTWAVFRAMLLSLWRDPGALVMAFVMPVAFFIIFAEIFANAAAGDFRLRVAVLDEVGSPASKRLLDALRRDPAVARWRVVADRAAVEHAVRDGGADAGVIVRADGEPLDAAGGFGPAPLLVVSDRSSAVAGALLTGRLQQAYVNALPELLVKSVIDLADSQFTELNATQRAEIAAGLDDMREEAQRGRPPAWSLGDLIEEQPVAGNPRATNQVAYYAGAIAFMFLLLSAAQGALTLLEERDSGVLDRIAAGPGGSAVAVNGKFLFLALQGMAQTLVIFAVARFGYDVDVLAAPVSWLAVAALSSAAAAGIGLALVCVCRSRAQAQTFSTAFIMVVSAVGGSMVPRFFMPGWLQDVGWLTPNTWVLEAYSGVLWRNVPLTGLALPAAMLLLTTLGTLLAAHFFTRRMMLN